MPMRPVLLASIAVLAVLLASGAGAAAEGKVTVSGRVAATEDDAGNVTAVKLTLPDKAVYNIVLDKKGKELGSAMDGARVEVTGTVVEKDGAKWLSVTGYRELEGEENG